MRCPKCQSPSSRVVDSRPSGATIRRRRKCLACSERWTTIEARVPDRSAYHEAVAELGKIRDRLRDVLRGT